MPLLGLGISTDKNEFFGQGNNVIEDGLQLYIDPSIGASYPGNDVVWSDLSSNSISGTLVNAPTFDAGESGGAILFEESSAQYADFTNNSVLQPTDEISIMGWCKPTVAQFGEAYILGNNHSGFGGTNHGYRLSLTVGTNDLLYVRFQLGNNSAGSTISVINAEASGYGYDSFSIDTWFFVVGTWDGVTMRLYVNNVHASAEDQAFAGPITYDSSVSTLIASSRTASTRFTGYIGSCMIYNRALTETEIRQNYNAHKSRYGL